MRRSQPVVATLAATPTAVIRAQQRVQSPIEIRHSVRHLRLANAAGGSIGAAPASDLLMGFAEYVKIPVRDPAAHSRLTSLPLISREIRTYWRTRGC